MLKLKLKIEDKGMVINIPGTPTARTPTEVDITNVDINLVFSFLRKGGFNKYKIFSVIEDETGKVSTPVKLVETEKGKKESDSDIDKRFSKLENMIAQLFSLSDKSKSSLNEEQITNKLDRLEKLSQSIINGQKKQVIYRETPQSGEPKIEELDDAFIPEIDTGGMQIKGTTSKAIKREDEDVDDAADLLSSITREEM